MKPTALPPVPAAALELLSPLPDFAVVSDVLLLHAAVAIISTAAASAPLRQCLNCTPPLGFRPRGPFRTSFSNLRARRGLAAGRAQRAPRSSRRTGWRRGRTG